MRKFQETFLDVVTKGIQVPAHLLSEIRPVGKLTELEVVEVYRQDYEARLEEALGKNYEATWLLLGDEEFHSVAQAYIKENPSELKNLTSYGQDFPDFLQRTYDEGIVEMAKFEKNFWQLFHLAPRTQKPLGAQELSSREFDLETGFYLSHSSLKLQDLWRVREGQHSDLSLDQFEAEEFLVLYRSSDKVEIQRINESQFQIFSLIKETRNLEAAFQKLEALNVVTVQEDWPFVFQVLSYF